MDLASNKVNVQVGKDSTVLLEQLRSAYTYKNIEDTTKGYTRSQGRIIFTTPPAIGYVIKIEYYKPLSMLTAEDRINFAYNPSASMYGKDLSQLMTGIDYGGVQVRSFDFDNPEGWDSKGWYTDSWDTFDNTYEDEVFVADGSTNAVQLSAALEDGIVYNLYKNGVRIDDPNFIAGTPTNVNAITNSITGDGVTDVVYVQDLEIALLDGDVFVVRKTTSDGAATPDTNSYDTALSGGDLAYATAKGLAAEEIIVDGDGFVTPTTSSGPEELVPGQVLDTLDIKVFTRDSAGQGIIHSQSYIMGSDTSYSLGVIPRTSPAVLVKVGNVILADSLYTIDWQHNSVVTLDSATPGAELNIIAMAQGTQKVLDFGARPDYLPDRQITITTVDWQEGTSCFVSIDGISYNVSVFNSADDSVPGPAKVGIRLNTPPTVSGQKIHYTVFSDSLKINYSQVSKDTFTTDGTTRSYQLATTPFYALPNEHNIIVKVANKILNPGYNIKYTIDEFERREYKIETFQEAVGSNSAADISVFVDGIERFTPDEWRFDIANSSIILADNVGEEGSIVAIYAITDGEYRITGNVVTLDTTPAADQTVEVFQFSNHDLLGMQRINYDVVERTLLVDSDIQQLHIID